MKKTKIYFVRHAESDHATKDERLRPLTEKGMNDTKRVTKALEDKNIDVIFSSPFKRAYDTIKDFADSRDFQINVVEGFKERKVDNVWIEDFKSFSRMQWEDFSYRLDSGESLSEVQKRNVDALYDVLHNHTGKNIIVGTHGTALSTIINHFHTDFGYEDFWGIIDKMPYIVLFEFEGTEFAGLQEVELLE